MTCPKCGNEYSGGRCGICGYDRSADCLHYPTLTPVSAAQAASADPEEERLRSMYETALAVEQAASTEAGFSAAALLYEQLGSLNYLNSADRARVCRQRAHELRTEQKKSFRGLLLIAAIVMVVLAAVAIIAWRLIPASEAAKYQYVLDSSGEAVLTGYRGRKTELVIPVSLDGHSVTSIGDKAFYNCIDLTSVTIPSGVTNIGDWAFAGCSSLTSVTVPAGVTSIGNSAFYGCSGLTNLTIPSGVTNIGDHAFYGCSGLTSVTILSGITSIGNCAFSGCRDLTSVTILSGVTSIGDEAFYVCSGLTSVTIPDSVTSIGNRAFSGCSGLTSVTIPDSVTSVGNRAFSGCSGLTSVTIPDSVTSVGNGVFSGCSGLTSVTIPESVTSIGDGAFEGCSSLTSVTIPESVTSIGSNPFSGCVNLNSIRVVSGNPRFIIVDDVLFSKDKTELIAFPGAKAGDYSIPYGVTSIGNSAFSGCRGLTSVTIPSGVTSIGAVAFYCRNMTSVTLPSSVTRIGEQAFIFCLSLQDVYYSGTQEQWNEISIEAGNSALTGATIHFNS